MGCSSIYKAGIVLCLSEFLSQNYLLHTLTTSYKTILFSFTFFFPLDSILGNVLEVLRLLLSKIELEHLS